MKSTPVGVIDVFMDNFLGLAQGTEAGRLQITRVLLHTMDEVLQPADPARPAQKEPASLKKLRKGDGNWDTRKTMLGWDVDTSQRTITLPQHRAERLRQIFAQLAGQRRTSTKTWHKILGELRSMALAVPGARGLFSALQTALQQREARHRIRITRPIRQQLTDFAALADNLHN
jgi:hypothetical protein